MDTTNPEKNFKILEESKIKKVLPSIDSIGLSKDTISKIQKKVESD